tara:strand:+ start:577 stop:2220 length:1644 start_codon:yes stop_codon:yes gene_type:complete
VESTPYLHVGKVINSRYRLITPFGSGPFTQVYLADDIRVRKQTIVKVFDETDIGGENFQNDFQTILTDLARTNHPNLIKILDWSSGETPYVVTEFFGGGDLRGMMQRDRMLSVAQITFIMMEILKGISHLHERGKVHGGLKPENIIFNLNGELKISDTGMRALLSIHSSSELDAEEPYLSPELTAGESLSPADDVFAIAVILNELIDLKLTQNKSTDEVQKIDSEILQELKSAFANALTAKASDRPGANALLKIISELNTRNAKPALLPVESSLNLNLLEKFNDQPEVIDIGRKPDLKARVRKLMLYLKSHLRRWLWLLVMGILVVGVTLLINSGNTEEKISVQAVPETSGLLASELIDQFDDYWALEEALTRKDGTQNGEILRTIPGPGVELEKGETLTYFVSLGPELRNIPIGLTGLTVDEAESILLGARLRLGQISQVPNEKIAVGLVIGPATPMTELPTGSEVDIQISAGPELRTIPDALIGRAYDSVETAIVLEGLQVEKTEVFHPTIKSGIVIRLEPESGSLVLRDEVVEIFVSRGPEIVE